MFFKRVYLKISRNSKKTLYLFNIFLNFINDFKIEFLGNNGFLVLIFKKTFFIKNNNEIQIFTSKNTCVFYSLIYNIIKGIIYCYEKKLILIGLGYKAIIKSDKYIYFYLSYSHPIVYKIPDFIRVRCDKNELSITCLDKQKLGEVCLIFKNYKKFNMYKNKGIKYLNDKVNLKLVKKK